MILNALACISVCNQEGIEKEKIKELLSSFENAKRRFKENIFGNIVTIDDYAHHPTEIKATLSAAKQKEHNRIISVFQPHTYSRTKELFDDFATSFSNSDIASVPYKFANLDVAF